MFTQAPHSGRNDTELPHHLTLGDGDNYGEPVHFTWDPSSSIGFFGGPSGFVGYAVLVLGLWPTLVKAGLPGWGALIPIYNVYLIIKMGQSSGWLLLLLLIPIVNIFVLLYVAFRVAEAFGYGALMAIVGLFLFPFIGFLVLGYGRMPYLPRRHGHSAPVSG
jgi:hypothetical protein